MVPLPPDDIDREEYSSLSEDDSFDSPGTDSPDADFPTNGFGVTASNAGNAASTDDAIAYAELDTGELEISEDSSKLSAADKVELDLEDAPFLEEEEEEQEPTPSEEPELDKDAETAPPLWKRLIKNRRFQIAAAALLLLIVAAVLAFILWPSAEEPQEPLPTSNQTTPVPAQQPEEPEPEVQTIAWEPFWVEYVVDQGEVRFLHAKFSATTTSEKLAFEISRKRTVIRDAIYYYLRNKDLTYLAKPENADSLKRDLLSVINQYLSTGQVDTLLIEEYLIK